MKLIIDSNFKLSEVNETLIRDKSSKFLKELESDTSSCVRLTVKKTELWFACQILYKDVIVVDKNADFYSCICVACKNFLNQLRRSRRRHVDKRRRQIVDASDNVVDVDEDVIDDVLDDVEDNQPQIY